MESLIKTLGIKGENENIISKDYIKQYIDLKLLSLGFGNQENNTDSFFDIAKELIENFREREKACNEVLCPADHRIQEFINNYFSDVPNCPTMHLPATSFTLDFHGLARELSIPPEKDEYSSEYLKSYRVKQGILHNPKNDKRTTKGVFHVAEGGLPIPDDKKAVPRYTTAYLLHKALTENGDIMTLPYTAEKSYPDKSWVSLLIRPIVCPAVEGITPEKTMEIRLFAPGTLVSNLDFVESIFGNAGNPYVLKNDAGIDIEHWTGYTGCVILAPQLTQITKKEAGLPTFEEATERQKRDGMCWKEQDELYNDGKAFKLTFRTQEGIIVTVIADNYFGYSKKEVKTQISYACNLFGNTEEEHAGGAFIFPSYNQGDKHIAKSKNNCNTFQDITNTFSDIMDVDNNENYGIDKRFNNIIYVPEDSVFSLIDQSVSWEKNNKKTSIKLLPRNFYVLPNGSKFRMERLPGTHTYRLVETMAEGTLFHKPCTVSGGGKSEISKSILDSILVGSFFIKDFDKDFEQAKEIINYNYSKRFEGVSSPIPFSRSFLSPQRSMGSVIKLLTPSPDFTDEYNEWLKNMPQYIKGIAFIIKRFYREEWGNDWKKHFSVDVMNGQPGNELKYENRKLVARYLRVGFDENGAWRTFKLRQDFSHAAKLSTEDDITASTVVPISALSNLNPVIDNNSVKIIANCEYRFFQRPDEAVHRGFDKKAEADLASSGTFISNFEPLTIDDAKDMVDDVIHFEKFTEPMQNLIKEVAEGKSDFKYFVSSANPRLVDGKPSANVRYLQTRSDLLSSIDNYLAEIGMRFSRNLPFSKPLYTPVNVVLPGRRNNPAEKGIPPLAVYNPVHYQELPELFMDFISSLTGKSPSTTGAGSEGALTKAPFNALLPITDLNNTLVSYILTGYNGFTTPAGYIGSKFRVDHDLSLLIPELWARLSPAERDPKEMIKEGFLEKLNDFEYKGKTVKASILGYRITQKFINMYFGRVFENPNVVFEENMLKPELQNIEEFADGIDNITEAQQKVAQQYFKDGSILQACEPLKALLHIMVSGNYEGKTLESPEIREMFTYDYLINSKMYNNRLVLKQQQDTALCQNHIHYLEQILKNTHLLDNNTSNDLIQKSKKAHEVLRYISSPDYLLNLRGMLGKDEKVSGN